MEDLYTSEWEQAYAALQQKEAQTAETCRQVQGLKIGAHLSEMGIDPTDEEPQPAVDRCPLECEGRAAVDQERFGGAGRREIASQEVAPARGPS
jgi:hypothetical protein